MLILFKVGILTASDKGYAGEREDKSAEVIKEILINNNYEVSYYKVLPDERGSIK